jgi:hypothetical protein
MDQLAPAVTISANDVQLIRQSRARANYSDLSVDERNAYQRVHTNLEQLGSIVRERLASTGSYTLKLTSGFNPSSGVRGYVPKDLWFAVSNERNADAFVAMPQLFMIVSERGIEYGFAASIHLSDLSTQEIRGRIRAAAPEIFKRLPQPASSAASTLQSELSKTGGWYFRRKTRLDPNIQEFPSLDEWLSFLKSPAGSDWAAGAISRYISVEDLSAAQPDFASLMEELANIFSTNMASITASAEPPNHIQKGLEEFLATYSSTRSTVPFGQHDELKNELNRLRVALEALPAVRAHPRVRVSWSVGQGNFARVPWIALMDDRETTSTQSGTYCVFLFPEDMSGVYLTLNQGVSVTINTNGRIEGRRILRDQAETMRQIVRSHLQSFSLNNDIDLHTEGMLGQDYEASTIAYRYYAKGQIPEDAALNDDIERLLTGYDQILEQRPAEEQTSTQWWIFQANPKIYDIDSAIRDLSEITWTVKHEATRASVGDRVFFWRAGRDAGVIALGTIIEAAASRESPPIEQQ